MTGSTSTGSRTDRFAQALSSVGSVTVARGTVLEHWARVAPELTGQPESIELLAATLVELAAAGTLELPAQRSWDRSTRPPLPNFVKIAASRKTASVASWRSVPWRAELGWVSSLRFVPDAHLTALRAINAWLGRRDAATPLVPARLRSAELFGDEKLLDSLARTELFGPGRLSNALLRVTRPAPPMPITRVGSGLDVLVVENADPYWAIVDILGGLDHPIGRVGWGSGWQVEHTIAAVWEGGGAVGQVWYWGDLDPDGVAMAMKAAGTARAAGLGEVRQHPQLWAALARCEPTGAGTVDWSVTRNDTLDDVLAAAVEAVRGSGGRVAQERLIIAELAAALM